MKAEQLALETCPRCGGPVGHAVNAQTEQPYRYCKNYPDCDWVASDAPVDALLRRQNQPGLFDEDYTPPERWWDTSR